MPDEVDLVLKRLAREIAARQEAERLLEAKSDELEGQRQDLLAQTAQVRRLSVAIDTAEEGIAIASTQGTFVYMNEAHARMFGYSSSAALIGQPWSCLYDSDALARFDREIMPLFGRDGRWAGEAVARTIDGTPVFQDLVLTALEDGGILCSTRDISQRRAREKETEELRRRLVEAERRAEIHQVVDVVTHDLFNLIGAIDANVTLIELQSDQPEAKKLIISVFDALHQARMVLEQLYPEYETPDPQMCDILDMTPRLCDLMAPLLGVSQTFYRIIPKTSLFVLADPTLLSRSITNILKNAMEAMSDDGDVLRLTVQSLPAYSAPALPFNPISNLTYGRMAKGPVARFIVHDEGGGMPQSVVDHALEQFVSTKESDRRRGVGLSSVKGLMDTTGGHLAIYSSPGTGTVIVLDLPAVDATSAERVAGIAEDVVGNVILVDDDPLALANLEAFFADRQWEAATFVDPLEALAFLERAPRFPQLLVTDRRMPRMSGDELAERAKRIRSDLPVIMCSNALDASVSDAVDTTLAKPIDHEHLQAALARLNLETGGAPS